MTDRYRVALFIGFAVFGALALGLGHFRPQIVPDTSGYLEPLLWPEIFERQRTPFYGIFIALLRGAENGFVLVPAVQAVILALATWVLFQAMRAWGASGAAALALTLPVLFSNPSLLFLNSIHPEILAISCVAISIAATLRLSSPQYRRYWYLIFGVSLGVAYLMKPAFVFFIPVLPVLYFMLLRLQEKVSLVEAIRRPAILLCIAALPFVGYAGLRAHVTGDFNIVSFGGFASSGLSGLMLNPDMVAKLPQKHQPLARVILEERERLAASGTLLPIPLNSENVRSFTSAALGYFGVLARSYDNVVFDIVARQQHAQETLIAFNARLQDFTIAVIKAEPISYIAWIIGAGTRIVGLITVANAAFMISFLTLAALFIVALIRGGLAPTSSSASQQQDVNLLLLIVGSYVLANCIPMMVLTFPARRYVDTAGMFLAALPFFGLLRLWPKAFPFSDSRKRA